MPTGYTDQITEDMSLRTFALICVRAMGVCITMRDDPADTPIPERFEPHDYHEKQVRISRERLQQLDGMSLTDVEAEWARTAAENRAKLATRLKENEATKARYERMLGLVQAWDPPGDVAGLKKFMVEQIEGSIKFDVHDKEELARWYAPPLGQPGDWLESQKAQARKDIAYHLAEHSREVELTEGRNRWLADLRASLPEEVPTTNT